MITALPDIHTRNISPEDEFIVLASDGIWYVRYYLLHNYSFQPLVNIFTYLNYACSTLVYVCL